MRRIYRELNNKTMNVNGDEEAQAEQEASAHLIILSGGTGSRMHSLKPKQYIEVCGRPVISYTLACFDFSLFKNVVIVLAETWKPFVEEICRTEYSEQNFIFAPAGGSRQESILNGLESLRDSAKLDDVVVIHDAARPCLRKETVDKLISACDVYEGAMPVLPVKDTVYLSADGREISGLLNRDQLFCGQAPEAFKYGRYLSINRSLSLDELSKVRGSSEIAFKHGMKVSMVEGDESNFKITTPADLSRFSAMIKKER